MRDTEDIDPSDGRRLVTSEDPEVLADIITEAPGDDELYAACAAAAHRCRFHLTWEGAADEVAEAIPASAEPMQRNVFKRMGQQRLLATSLRGTRDMASATRSPAVTVETVTHNSADVLPGLVESLEAGMVGTSIELVVVDNARTDQSTELAFALMPFATVVRAERNGRYASGINLGVASARPADVPLVLNPDVRLEPGCAATLAAALDDPAVGTATRHVVDGSDDLVYSMRRKPTLLRMPTDALMGACRAGRIGSLGEVATGSQHEPAGRGLAGGLDAADRQGLLDAVWVVGRVLLRLLEGDRLCVQGARHRDRRGLSSGGQGGPLEGGIGRVYLAMATINDQSPASLPQAPWHRGRDGLLGGSRSCARDSRQLGARPRQRRRISSPGESETVAPRAGSRADRGTLTRQPVAPRSLRRSGGGRGHSRWGPHTVVSLCVTWMDLPNRRDHVRSVTGGIESRAAPSNPVDATGVCWGRIMGCHREGREGVNGVTRADKPIPVVSVVIPCYNYGRYLSGCVCSVLDQQGPFTIQILVINDMSSDDTAQVADHLAQLHPNVEVIHHAANRGHIATYNEGLLEWARGDYLMLLSADDELATGSLARSVSLMEQHPRIGMVYGRSVILAEDGRLSGPPGRFRGFSIWPGPKWLAGRCREGVNVVPTPGVLVRGSVHRRVGGYDPALPHTGDMEMWLRIAAISDIGYVRGVVQARYRMHPKSMSQEIYRDQIADVRERRMMFEKVFREHPDVVAGAGISPSRTWGRLASEPLWLACRAYEKDLLGERPVANWIAWSKETYPEYESLRAYRALNRRIALGPSFCRRTKVFIGTTIARKATNALWWAKWRYTGV